MKWLEIVIAAALGAMVSLAVSYLTLNTRVESLENQLAEIHPVAVVDYYSIAQNNPKSLDEVKLKAKILELDKRAHELADRGFVVLRSEAVVAAPGNLTLADHGSKAKSEVHANSGNDQQGKSEDANE